MQCKTKFNNNNRYIFCIYHIKVCIILRTRNQIVNNLVDTKSKTQSELLSRYNTVRICHTNKEVRPINQEVRSTKRRREMIEMITIRSTVSGKYGNLITNPQQAKLKREREEIFGTVEESVGENKYIVLFHNSSRKDIHSNSLRLEQSMVVILVGETIEVDASNETIEANENLGEEKEEYFNLGLVATKEDIKEASDNLSI